jgi:hypothetical protein
LITNGGTYSFKDDEGIAAMLELSLNLLVGFVLGFGARELISRHRRALMCKRYLARYNHLKVIGYAS